LHDYTNTHNEGASSRRWAKVLRILGITQLDPPTPEKGQESLM